MGRSDLTVDALASLIAAGDAEGVAALFEGASDQDRSRVRPSVAEHPSYLSARVPTPQQAAQTIGWLASAAARTIGQEVWWLRETPPHVIELAVKVLGERPERFRTALAKQLLGTDWGVPWPLLRGLVRTGAIDPSLDDDAYIRAFARNRGVGLADDPELAEREIWRLFEVTDAINDWVADAWSPILAEVSRRSPAARSRMVDAVLLALGTDFAPGQLSGFLKIAVALEVTDAELGGRVDAIRGLCAGAPSVQKVALGWLDRLARAGAIESADAAECLRGPLGGTRKNLAEAALKQLDRLAEESASAISVAATGLGHPHPDVAARTLKLISKHARGGLDEAVRADLLGWLDVAPPALRPQLADLVGIESPAERPQVAVVPVPPARAPSAADRYAPDRALRMPTDPEETVGLLATVLEGQGNGDDLELAIAGLFAMAGQWTSGAKELLSPIHKRAAAILQGPEWNAAVASRGVASAVVALNTRKKPRLESFRPLHPDLGGPTLLQKLRGGPGRDEPPHTIGWLLRLRLNELATALAKGQQVTLLATPTHRGGHLDPEVLRSRSGLRTGAGPVDTRVARLRAGLAGQSPAVRVRHTEVNKTYGQRGWGFEFERSPAGRSDDPLVEGALSFLCLHGEDRYRAGVFTPWLDSMSAFDGRVCGSVLSTRPDVFAAFGAAALAERISQAQVSWFSPAPMLEALADPAVPLDGPALTLLCLGLGAKVEFQAAAVDALIAAVDDGRIDADAMGREAAALHHAKLLVLTRVEQPILDAASAGPAHRAVGLRFLLTLVGDLDGRPTGLHGPLDAAAVLADPGVEIPPAAEAALRDLAGRSSRAGKAAAAILSATGR